MINRTTFIATPKATSPTKLQTVAVLFLVLAVRLVHLGSTAHNPLTFQPGPDEDFYYRFGRAVAENTASDTTEFAFMDPAYGYILGLIFKVAGTGLYPVFLIQAVLDTATAWILMLIGRELDRPVEGILGALLYGFASTAVMYSTVLLKAVWAANFMALWVFLALLTIKNRGIHLWIVFGLFCGYGIALRSNLLLMFLTGVALLPWLWMKCNKSPLPAAALRLGVLLIGIAIPLNFLSVRNHQMSATFSPIPNNGGIVLHHIYNAENPRAVSSVPDFVSYKHPSEIWFSYAREAERRIGRKLSAHEVDLYWRNQAYEYILSDPVAVLSNVARKAAEFLAYIEVPNNRSMMEEKLFSPVLRVLPEPFGWLVALGLPGIFVLIRRDRRAFLLLAPVAVTIATTAFFFAEGRFRFHCVPVIALGSGMFIGNLFGWLKNREFKKCIFGIAAGAILGCLSFFVAHQLPQHKINWGRIIWGSIKMGEIGHAKNLAGKILKDEPMNIKVQEALGFIAERENNYPSAVEYYQKIIEYKPDAHIAHYNLARVLFQTGAVLPALDHARMAEALSPLPEYRVLVQKIMSRTQLREERPLKAAKEPPSRP